MLNVKTLARAVLEAGLANHLAKLLDRQPGEYLDGPSVKANVADWLYARRDLSDLVQIHNWEATVHLVVVFVNVELLGGDLREAGKTGDFEALVAGQGW